MKIGKHRAIAHNIADSLGSGCGLLIGVYDMNIYGEAEKNSDGVVAIDLFAGKVIQGKVSRTLTSAVKKYRAALPSLCASHGAAIEDFRTLTARYSGDAFDKQVVVAVRDRIGRCYVDEYIGIPSRRVKIADRLGRIRTKRGAVRRFQDVSQSEAPLRKLHSKRTKR